MRRAAQLICLLLGGLVSRASAEGMDGLYDRIAADLKAGRPLVLQAHVALCDNDQVRCGSKARGDGDDPAQNLYWATSGGFVGWFHRRGSPWHEVLRDVPDEDGVLERRVMRADLPAQGALRARGALRVPAYVVALAWRGPAITDSMAAWAKDLLGDRPRIIRLADGQELRAGGAAHVVAYIGHNRLMDLSGEEQRAVLGQARAARPRPKGLVAVACRTVAYLPPLISAERVPLLLTADLLFAGSHPFEGVARALAAGESLMELRATAIDAYAEGEGKEPARVRSIFTNPGDPRWDRLLARYGFAEE